jgi:replicative DNA helicase
MNQEILPPWNEEIEKAALGCMLIDARAAELAIEELARDDFYDKKHQTLFKVFSELFIKYENLDEIFVIGELSGRGLLENIGGKEIIGKLIMAAPSAAGIETYIATLRDLTERRAILNMTWKVSETLNPEDNLQIIGDCVDKIYNRRANVSGDPEDLHALAVPVANECMMENPRDFWGIQCGIAGGAIDDLTGGIQANQFWVLAARTSMGKSTFVRELATGLRRVNPGEGRPLILSTEMEASGIARAGLASAAGVAQELVLKRKLNDTQLDRVNRVIEQRELEGVSVLFDPALTIQKIRAITKRHKRKNGLSLLVVDLAGQIRLEGNKSEYERLCEISRSLGELKKEFQVCLIACVQVSRAVHMNEDKRPDLKDLKGSGSWEEDADRVLFIHRPSYFGKSDNRTEIIQAKDRVTGRVGSTFLQYLIDEGRYVRAAQG